MGFKRKRWRGLSIRAARRRIIVITALTLIIGGFNYSYWKMSRCYEEQYDLLQQQIIGKTRTAYLPINDILAGQTITSEDVGEAAIISDMGQEWYLTKEDLGRQALVDLPSNQPILKFLTSEETITQDLREEEFKYIELMSNQAEHDYVDVRIMFESGEDYLVLAKKKVRNLNLEENRCYFWLNTEEILRMSSASVDVFMENGAKLYTVKYVETYMQQESIPNYPVNSTVLNLIASDPNIIDTAKEALSKKGKE